jgi:putative FmdB family regulatory protein
MMARAMATLMRLNEDASTPSRGQLSLGCYNVAMPIYEYICDDCKTPFERLVLNKQQEISCPKCASKKATIQLSVFATSHGSTNGASAKSSTSFSGGEGGCCGGSCGCH